MVPIRDSFHIFLQGVLDVYYVYIILWLLLKQVFKKTISKCEMILK